MGADPVARETDPRLELNLRSPCRAVRGSLGQPVRNQEVRRKTFDPNLLTKSRLDHLDVLLKLRTESGCVKSLLRLEIARHVHKRGPLGRQRCVRRVDREIERSIEPQGKEPIRARQASEPQCEAGCMNRNGLGPQLGLTKDRRRDAWSHSQNDCFAIDVVPIR